MQKKFQSRIASLFVFAVMTAALALFPAGCSRTGQETGDQDNAWQTVIQTNGEVIGTGASQFTLTVTAPDGSEAWAEIHTDQQTVGAALEALGLISGEDSPTGIYVKTVNGVTVDYDKDGMYWAFYVNGEYAQTGVDSTNITEGDTYAFKAEKA